MSVVRMFGGREVGKIPEPVLRAPAGVDVFKVLIRQRVVVGLSA